MAESLLQSLDARGVATLTLNRPDEGNAFDEVLVERLTEVLLFLAADRAVRAIVLNAAGTVFCSGTEFDWRARQVQATPIENLGGAEAVATLLRTLDRLHKPTVAVVQGAAHGLGVGLAAACDIALADETASFTLADVRRGTIPAVVGPYIVKAIGLRQARRYFLTGETIPVGRAFTLGLVHDMVLPEAMSAALETMLAALVQGAPGALASAKDLAFLAESNPFDQLMVAETARRLAEARGSDEAREGIAAILDERKPDWRP